MRPRRPVTVGLCSMGLAVALVCCGCGLLDREAAATWDLAPDQAVGPDATAFTVLVTRLGCNSGVTGDVNEPDVAVTDDRVVITFTVSPGEPSAANCQGNNPVRHDVELREPIGARDLVDGACLEGEARSTTLCRRDGGRRSGPG